MPERGRGTDVHQDARLGATVHVAGAGAFVGTLSRGALGQLGGFATAFYRSLADGATLGAAALAARVEQQDDPLDPTWLAYTVYGDRSPRRRLTGRRLNSSGGRYGMDVIDYSVPVEELVSAVKYAVKQAGISTTDEGRDLRDRPRTELIWSAVRHHEERFGGVDFRVPVIGWKVKMGGSRVHQRTHTIDITLVAEDLQDQHELRHGAVEATLVDAITTIRAVVTAGSGGDDPLVLKAGTVELVFGVTDRARSRSARRVS